MMPLVPLMLILRKKKKPLPQPRNAAHAVQPVLARRRPYDAAMARSEALYYRAHNDLITETWGIASWFPRCVRPTIDDAWIRERLAAALEECRDGDNLGRIVDTTQRTRAAVKEDVQRAVAPLNAKIERLEALLQQALLRDTSKIRR